MRRIDLIILIFTIIVLIYNAVLQKEINRLETLIERQNKEIENHIDANYMLQKELKKLVKEE